MKTNKDLTKKPVFMVKKVRKDRYIIILEEGNFYVANEYYSNSDDAEDRALDLNLAVRR